MLLAPLCAYKSVPRQSQVNALSVARYQTVAFLISYIYTFQ
jgi:hypothetical protein